jgi:Holliday junction resolvasome RuvABC endonuclease subunit
MSKILAFDVSSTTIGWGSLLIDDQTKEINLLDCGYIKPIKDGSIVDRIVHTRDRILEIINKQKPDYIGVEDIIKFMKGKSTADTIIMLTTFNRMTCLLAYDYLKKLPELFNVMTIRHGLKIGKILPKKEEMPELVAKHLGITFPYEYEINKRSKIQKISEESYDTADGIAVALYYAFILTGKKIKKPAATKTKKNKKTKRVAKATKKGTKS